MFLPHFLSFLLPPFLPASSSIFSLSLSWSKGESPASGICKGSLVSLKHQVHFRQSFSGVFSSCIPSHFCAGPPLSEKTLLSSSFHPVLTFQLDKKADTALTPRSHLKKTLPIGTLPQGHLGWRGILQIPAHSRCAPGCRGTLSTSCASLTIDLCPRCSP